jgi:multicomponent Na+:H+ antiporter subunit D
MMNILTILPLFIVVPIVSACLILLFGKFLKHSSGVIIFISSGLMMGLSVYARFLLGSIPGKMVIAKIAGIAPYLSINMVLDGLSGFMLVIVNTVAFFVVIYSLGYVEKYKDKPKFFSLFSLMVCGLNGVIINGDIFNLFVFLEVASLASYALVAFGIEGEELEASFKYAIMGSVASSFILMGIAFLYSMTSTLNISDIAVTLAARHYPGLGILFVAVLFMAGFGLKAAMIPFHAWLPDAHSSAPASISAMLSGVLIKTLGVYTLARMFFTVLNSGNGYLAVFMFLGAIAIAIEGMLALSQMNLKRLLAYSSISQIGYIILGLGLGTPLGIFGGLFHLLNHSIFKSLLFLNAGALDYSTHTKDIEEAKGAGRAMSVTNKTNLIGSLSISGIPPFSGFFSKLIIIIACVQTGHLVYAFCAVIGSIFTLCALMKVRKFVFLSDVKEKLGAIRDIPWSMKFSMVCLAVMCVFGGLMLLPPMRVFIQDAVNVLLKV